MSDHKSRKNARENKTKSLPLYRRIANFVIENDPNKVSIHAITTQFGIDKAELSTELNKLKAKDSPVYSRVKGLMY